MKKLTLNSTLAKVVQTHRTTSYSKKKFTIQFCMAIIKKNFGDMGKKGF